MNITINSKDNCPQCRTAIQLVRQKGHEPEVIKLGQDITREQLLELAPGARMMPQVAIDGKIIGSLRDLVDHFNRLDQT